MSFAANLAGQAISISKTTAPHAVSYPFTSIYNISHGHAVSLTLNDFLSFNYKNLEYANCNFDLKKRYNILFSLTNVKNFYDFDKFILNLKKKANLESDFKKLGINLNRDLNQIISGVNIQRLSNNPIDLNEKDVRHLLLAKINRKK